MQECRKILAICFLALVFLYHMNLMDFVDNNSDRLYYMGRLSAVLIIGPILTCKGVEYSDNLLIFIGVLLIIWDGIKVGIQIRKSM